MGRMLPTAYPHHGRPVSYRSRTTSTHRNVENVIFKSRAQPIVPNKIQSSTKATAQTLSKNSSLFDDSKQKLLAVPHKKLKFANLFAIIIIVNLIIIVSTRTLLSSSNMKLAISDINKCYPRHIPSLTALVYKPKVLTAKPHDRIVEQYNTWHHGKCLEHCDKPQEDLPGSD
jgi:hypothetical protein